MAAYIGRINELRQKLALHGYNKFQIHEIIVECIGKKDLETISDEEAETVISALEEYISFAQKCKRPLCVMKK